MWLRRRCCVRRWYRASWCGKSSPPNANKLSNVTHNTIIWWPSVCEYVYVYIAVYTQKHYAVKFVCLSSINNKPIANAVTYRINFSLIYAWENGLWAARLTNLSIFIRFVYRNGSIMYSPGFFAAVASSLSFRDELAAKLLCDVRLSDRLNVSRRFRSDDNDVDFFGDPLVLPLFTSSSLSARTYKFPIFSLIFTLDKDCT